MREYNQLSDKQKGLYIELERAIKEAKYRGPIEHVFEGKSNGDIQAVLDTWEYRYNTRHKKTLLVHVMNWNNPRAALDILNAAEGETLKNLLSEESLVESMNGSIRKYTAWAYAKENELLGFTGFSTLVKKIEEKMGQVNLKVPNEPIHLDLVAGKLYDAILERQPHAYDIINSCKNNNILPKVLQSGPFKGTSEEKATKLADKSNRAIVETIYSKKVARDVYSIAGIVTILGGGIAGIAFALGSPPAAIGIGAVTAAIALPLIIYALYHVFREIPGTDMEGVKGAKPGFEQPKQPEV